MPGRLGFAHLTASDDRSFGQWVFLETVARMFPGVMADLRNSAVSLDDWAAMDASDRR
jgi:hypothetical protein